VKQQHLNQQLIQFILRAQHIALKDTHTEQGYAMMVVSILSVVMFSLLAAALTLTNLSQLTTNAYTNANSTFYVAESALNRRAQELRAKFIGYARPNGTSPINKMESCLTGAASTQGNGDFGCTDYSFRSSIAGGRAVVSSTGGSMTTTDRDDSQTYISSTFVLESTANPPPVSIIPQGDLFAGMSMQEYTYQVYSSAKTLDAINSNNTDRTVLQMNLKARLVPLFQFAAFYNGDLEILPGAAMILSGPIHSNGSLYLGGGSSLTIQGGVTSVGSIYSKRKNDNSTYADNVVRIATSAPGVVPIETTSLLTANDQEATVDSLLPANLTTTFGQKVRSGFDLITVPQIGFLGKTDLDQYDGIGSYYGKADLRIEYQPNRPIPLAVTTIKTGFAGADSSTCGGLDISSDRNAKDKLVCAKLSQAQLWSLRQPVLVKALNNNERALAPADQNFAASPTPANLANAIALQKAIVRSSTLLDFSNIDVPISAATLPELSVAELTPFLGFTPKQIANQAGYFYLPAPIQIYNGFINNREQVGGVSTNIGLLQTNLKSLVFWNRDNVVVSASNVDTSQDEVLFQRLQNPLATGSKYATVCNGGASDPRSNSLQCLGLATKDTSEGGLAIHATVNTTTAANPTAAPTYTAGQSPYGFAFVGGSNLPGALTIASDQAVYLQGDYNYYDSNDTTDPNHNVVTHPYNMSNRIPANSGLKEPAAVLADSINILSNNCNPATSTTDRLNCGINGVKNAALNTSINVAFLAGTDVTIPGVSYNGGLENYPRFHENWAGQTLLYRGSFVSLGAAQNVSGIWANQVYTPPVRNWNYDLSFNDAANLPPLTPRLFYISQNVFNRKWLK
jgi:Tfp pilus assembly protein PilX